MAHHPARSKEATMSTPTIAHTTPGRQGAPGAERGKLRAAIYARKSQDDSDRNEEARSTTRQVERATAYAVAHGWTVDPRYIFTDDAVSGAEWEWLERPAPELAIVDQALWERVQARREQAAAMFLRFAGGQLRGRPSGADIESPYLLSGIAECAVCGGSLVAMTRSHGRQRMPFDGCIRYHKRGVESCRNGVQIRQDVLDEAVLGVLSGALDADVLAEAVTAAVTVLQTGQAEAAARRAALTQELATIATRERRLLDALVDVDASAGAIRERLRAELARRDALTAELSALDDAPEVDGAALTATLTERAADLRGLLARHVTQARQVVRVLLEGRLRCDPFDDERGKGYAFAATGTYQRLGVPRVNVGGGPNGIRTRVSVTTTFSSNMSGASRSTSPETRTRLKHAPPEVRRFMLPRDLSDAPRNYDLAR
jgi:hypothetical protein